MTSQSGVDLGPFAPLAEKLQGITEALAATTTKREVIEIVLTPAVQALGATAGIVLLVDQTDQQMKIAGSQGYEDGLPTLWQEGPIQDHVLITDILRMKEALYFEYAGALKEAYPELESRTGGFLPVANATLPMFLDNRPLGVILLDFTEPHIFTTAERRFLRILSAQCAVALGRAEATILLEARVEERTRQLEEERAAQDAFVAFTEAVGTETDLSALYGHAFSLLGLRFSSFSCGYYTLEDHLWKLRIHTSDLYDTPALLAVLKAGLPMTTPGMQEAAELQQPIFIDAWDPERNGIEHSEAYGTSAAYPLVLEGVLSAMLAIGIKDRDRWAERDRAVFRAVGRGLSLALERRVAGAHPGAGRLRGADPRPGAHH